MPRFEAKGWFFEIERDGLVVRTFTGAPPARPKVGEKTYPTEESARFAYGKRLAEHRHLPMGPSRHLAHETQRIGSTLLVDEWFERGDDRFLGELLAVTAAGKLAALAAKWYGDTRPWARRMLLAYIDDGCDRLEHKGLVKRLFKLAEQTADDEAMAHFLVAFDGFGSRLLVEVRRDKMMLNDPAVPERLTRHGQKLVHPRFSRATRRYLARRAYRYFRRIGHRDLARYSRGLHVALPLYRDESLATAARLLDAWGLVHALYGRSEVIHRGTHGITLAGNLAALAPAPQFPDAWKGFAELVETLVAARSRTVRNWTLAWLRAHHAAALATLPFARVKQLVLSPHEELQQLGGELLGKLRGLEILPISEWLELLAIDNLDVVELVCAVVAKHVTPTRLTLEQCIALACAKTAPVARLGLAWARDHKVTTAADLAAIARLVKAGVATVRAEGTAWATATLTTHPLATPEHLRDLCDAPHADAREAALAIAAGDKLATPALWYALTESPYDDVRAVVVKHARRWRDEAPPATLRHVWSTAMLNVHRGSTVKRQVPRAIAERIAAHPAEARELLPILAIALRSVRPAERATAIAALVRATHADAALRTLAHELIPELTITEQAV